MTKGRRSPPVPQLMCTGGAAGCRRFVPNTVQCYNKGSDGIDIQWKCETDMNKKYRFGKIAVSCEGYDYADDAYILAGSCALKYEIDFKNRGKATKTSRTMDSSYDFGELIWIILVLCFVFLVYRLCISRGNNTFKSFFNSNNFGEMPGGAYPREPPPAYGFKPEYFPQQNTKCFEDTQHQHHHQQQQQQQQQSFVSGMATGGVLGYMLGKETGSSRCDNAANYYHSEWFPDTSHNVYTCSSDSCDDEEHGLTTGYGGTTRR
ncbi:store-operated calcium entry-associated regulatory factor-like [Argonauta hians]